VEVGIDLLVEVLELALELALGDVAGTIVGGLELAAVDGDELAAEEVEVAAEQDESAADLTDGFAVVFAKVGDGLAEGPGTMGKSGVSLPRSQTSSRLRPASLSRMRLERRRLR
jgi:hypothetical protein